MASIGSVLLTSLAFAASFAYLAHDALPLDERQSDMKTNTVEDALRSYAAFSWSASVTANAEAIKKEVFPFSA